MDIKFNGKVLLVFLVALSASLGANAQLSAPGSEFSGITDYPVFPENDSIYVFCTQENSDIGQLRVETGMEGTKTFLWEKYNPGTAVFEFYYSESSESLRSTIGNLGNGCYRATVRLGDSSEVSRAWVMNDWVLATATPGESNCEYFELIGTYLEAQLKYYDLSSNSEVEINKDTEVVWKKGQNNVARVLMPKIYDPPTEDTEYTLTVSDKFGCSASAATTYISIVTKASFTVDGKFDSGTNQGEAPLEVTFTNTSENGDAGKYEWFFYRNLDDIKKESETATEPVDSIMFVAYNDEPVYTYEVSGTYIVKLVSKKYSEFHVCTDTFEIEDYIVADTSFIEAPNVFTPNGDGTNDNFVVKFWSMKDIKITIFNRWGKKVHYWELSNIQGFEDTWEESVWDGRIGKTMATPGVYFYVVEGTGRDATRRRAHGFFHLFRSK